jgi:hypothetical protein
MPMGLSGMTVGEFCSYSNHHHSTKILAKAVIPQTCMGKFEALDFRNTKVEID